MKRVLIMIILFSFVLSGCASSMADTTAICDDPFLSDTRIDACFYDYRLCDKISSDYMSAECYVEKAIDNNDLGTCELVKDNTLKDLCMINIAKNNLDLFSCTNIKSPYVRDDCILKINIFENRNLDYCNFLEFRSSKDMCTSTIRNNVTVLSII